MVSGEMSLMNGKSDAMAIVAAKAVFPAPEGPWRRAATKGVRSDFLTCSTSRLPSLSVSWYQLMSPLVTHVDLLSIMNDSILDNLL